MKILCDMQALCFTEFGAAERDAGLEGEFPHRIYSLYDVLSLIFRFVTPF